MLSSLAWACGLARTDYVFTSDNFAHVFCDLLQSVQRSSPAALRRTLICREARGKKSVAEARVKVTEFLSHSACHWQAVRASNIANWW